MNSKSGAIVTIVLALLLCALAVGVYAGSFDNEFVWDDPIVFKRQLPYFDSFENVFFPPKSIPQFGSHYYRPLIVVSYQLDEKIIRTFWPTERWEEGRRLVYHTSPVIYHAIVTLLVFFFGLSIARASRWFSAGQRTVAAAIAAGLFAVHPIHVESVAWMAGRSDVVCGIFFLLTLISYLHCRLSPSKKRKIALGVAAVIFGFAAMLSKETGVGLIFAVPLLDLFLLRGIAVTGTGEKIKKTRAEIRRAERRAKSKTPTNVAGAPNIAEPLLAWVVLGATAMAYFLLRSSALEGAGKLGQGKHDMLNASFGSLGWYFWKVIWPPPQSAFIAEVPGMPFVIFGVLLSASVVALMLWSFRRPSLGDLGAEISTFLLFFATLAPSMAIAILRISETPLAERYLYLPSAGICLAFSFGLVRLAHILLNRATSSVKLVVPAATAVAIAVPAGIAAVDRSKVWATDFSFWEDAVAKAPDQGLPHLHMGLALNALEGDFFYETKEQYELALKTYDDREGRSKAFNNLASLHMGKGMYEEAIVYLDKALLEVPRYPTAYFNRSMCKLNLSGQATDAQRRQELFAGCLSDLRTAIDLNPRYTKALYQYGRLLVQIGRTDEGRRHLLTVTKIAPGSDLARRAQQHLDSM